MNYADLFRVTLPETVLEIAALLVLVVDLGVVRKAALQMRLAVAAIVGIAGCGIAIWSLSMQGSTGLTYGGGNDLILLGVGGYICRCASRHSGSHRAYASAAHRALYLRATQASMSP